MHVNSLQQRMRERYIQGAIPWDDVLPPPEVTETVAGLPLGRALDLGCGYGRSAIYLAGTGWQVDAVDFVEEAIAEARRRASAAGVGGIRFHVASVTDLSFLTGPFDLAIDVGCGHSLDEGSQIAYWSELKRLLRPGATFLWFLRLSIEAGAGDGPRGIPLERARHLYAGAFHLIREAIGMTDMTNESSWPSAWLWLERLSDEEVVGSK